MKLVLQTQLVATDEQKRLLLLTMEKFNAAASFAAKTGFDNKVFSSFSIHYRCYADLRLKYGISAQMAVRAIGKAADVFARDTKKLPVFKPHSAMILDDRLFSIKTGDSVSILTVQGRIRVPLVMGDYHKNRLFRRRGQADLVYRKESGRFFLLITVDVPEGSPITPKDAIGVDLGVVRIATDSDGESHSGDAVEACRQGYAKLRANLQSCGSKSAKRHLKRAARKETAFRKNENHRISKALVAKARDTERAIALEDLKGIRERTTVRRKQRARHTGWSFQQLRAFIEYKAKLAGVPVVIVDAHNTSRTCPQCGHCEKANRKNQAEFVCRHCGYSNNADVVGALNIRAKALPSLVLAAVNPPMAGAA
jgi:IS605 OrfB family transposase